MAAITFMMDVIWLYEVFQSLKCPRHIAPALPAQSVVHTSTVPQCAEVCAFCTVMFSQFSY